MTKREEKRKGRGVNPVRKEGGARAIPVGSSRRWAGYCTSS